MSDYTGSNTPIDIRNLWQTPPEIAAALNKEFHFVGDAAASDTNHLYPLYLTEEQNALETEWDIYFPPGYIWINPPYSDITPWVRKASQIDSDEHGAVMLVPADTSVGWFNEAKRTCSEIRFITGGRLSFVRADTGKPVNGNNKGSMLLIWNPHMRGVCNVSFVERDLLMEYGAAVAGRGECANERAA